MNSYDYISPEDLELAKKGIDPYADGAIRPYGPSPIAQNKLQNLDNLLSDFQGDKFIGDEGLQQELMDAIIERAKVLESVRVNPLPKEQSGDMAYRKRDIDALTKAGFDPNDAVSLHLLDLDKINTDYDDPTNTIYEVLDGY